MLILFVVMLGGTKEQGHRLSVFERAIHGKKCEAWTGVSGVSDDNASVCDAEAVWTVMKSQKL